MSNNEQGSTLAGQRHANSGRSLKLAPFWTSKPVSWLAQTEAAFAIKAVTDSYQKYCHMLYSLNNDLLCSWSSLLWEPRLSHGLKAY
jgi:hypothetical protein